MKLRVSPFALGLLFAGCSANPNSLWMVAGSGAGAALGTAVKSHGVLPVAVGAVVGSGVAAAAVGRGDSVREGALNEGYLLGASDAVKRMYWARQAEQRPVDLEAGHSLLGKVLKESDETPDPTKS